MNALTSIMAPGIVPVLMVLLSYVHEQFLIVNRLKWNKEYDYIIVGSGSAGAVVASRLSEDPSVTVLLLEAGGSDPLLSQAPFAAVTLQNSPADWAYRTVPQENSCLSMKGRRSAWPRGKALGGSSVINFMLYVRGNRRDYDLWAAEGCEGWAWKDVFPYFLKAEDQRDPRLLKNGYHSKGGPMSVSPLIDIVPTARAFVESAKYLGYPVGDYNGRTQAVFSYPQGTTRDGLRWQVTKAYLWPAYKRPNLHIVALAHVSKILFKSSVDSPQPVAHGVRFRHDLADHEVFARKEVIISAGSINSPQLLMLSGIGPAHHLEELNIPVLADLPVGENLHEQPFTNLMFSSKKHSSYTLGRTVNIQNIIDLLVHHKGPLTGFGGISGLGFVKTNYTDAHDDWPDIEIHMTPTSVALSTDLYGRAFSLTDEYINEHVKPYSGQDTFSLYPVLLRPKSRGTIRLHSSDFRDSPLIDPRYFEHPDDIDALVEGAKICLAVARTPPYQAIDSEPFQTPVPGCEEHELYSDDYLHCLARHFTAPIYHPVGTCRMGALDDPRTVVDSRLRVKGVKNLRVVDASVMPYVVSGNINAPTIMIGEKAADIIKGVI